jgi:dTDP-4-amino-4,6-dideoxygalactose transaminase
MSVPTPPAILGGDRAFPDGLALVRPHLGDVPALGARLTAIAASGNLTNGPTVRELEETLADRLQVDHVVAVSSCTAGLMLVLQSLGADGRVVMPSMTFAASAHAVSWAGGRPVFADVDPGSLTLDPASAAAGADGASAITATHIYGTPCDVEALQEVADRAGIPVVYDAAHALGSSRAGRPIGGFGAAEVFSMSPTKVTTAGEGGIVATQHAEIAEHVRLGRNYGNSGDYDCAFPGLNARMSEFHAAVALAGLAGLDERLAHRRVLVEAFWTAVAGVPGLRRPVLADGDTSTYKDLTLVVEPASFGLDVPCLTAALTAEGIDSRRYFFPPIHRQKAYADLPRDLDLSVTEDVSTRVITPPLWSAMSVADVQRLADLVIRVHHHAPEVRQELRRREQGNPR